jgi:hypothetical protein
MPVRFLDDQAFSISSPALNGVLSKIGAVRLSAARPN